MAKDAATVYIEEQIKKGTISKPHGISYVTWSRIGLVDDVYWVVRFHLDEDYTSTNCVEIIIRIDGLVIEPVVKERASAAEAADQLDPSTAG